MKSRNWPIYLILLILAVVFALPFLWMMLTSLKSLEESVQISPFRFFPSKLVFSNYIEIVKAFPMLRWYSNSIIVTFIASFGQIMIGSLAAYAFARLRFPLKNLIFISFLALIMVPEQIFIIVRFRLFLDWGLTNTLLALWLPKIFSIFAVFFLRQFIQSIPRDLDEAAMIDGAGYLRIFSTIILPLLKAPFVSLIILTGLGVWKELMWPIIVIQDLDKLTVIAGLARIADRFAGKHPQLMVGGVLGTFPIIILFVIMQKRFVKSITSDGIKM